MPVTPVIRRSRRRGGFTFVELVVVAAVLAALASIAFPQFSAASSDSRRSAVQSTVRTLRKQVALYRAQHCGQLPNLIADWDPLLARTDCAGTTDPRYGVPAFGPYVHGVPTNALNGSAVVANGNGSGPAAIVCGYVYDYAGGTGSGQIWATDVDGKVLIIP